jgi:hypothetical protein
MDKRQEKDLQRAFQRIMPDEAETVDALMLSARTIMHKPPTKRLYDDWAEVDDDNGSGKRRKSVRGAGICADCWHNLCYDSFCCFLRCGSCTFFAASFCLACLFGLYLGAKWLVSMSKVE